MYDREEVETELLKPDSYLIFKSYLGVEEGRLFVIWRFRLLETKNAFHLCQRQRIASYVLYSRFEPSSFRTCWG